jgi:hypothetical protein
MGLTTKKLQTQLVAQDAPHLWEVKIPNHPNCISQMHCGNIKDAERILETYPGSTITKIYLPHPPTTVDVPHTIMDPDLELPEQKILPQSELETLEL